MADSFFFYDLETSGFNPRSARIMQFAGQRTDLKLKPIGDPINVLIKMTPDIVPDPDAILVTGITPQQTLADGLTEVEFLELFYKDVVKPGTIFTGFNNIRFDDEFMRFLNYRNFYDAYEWQWKDSCSRWDILDAVRMTRALRPEGIKWPFAPDGKPTNRLEFLTSVNKLDHSKAHDALNDVMATIAVAKLIHEKQPDLFEYLLSMRSKKKVAELVEAGQPFIYTSGRFPSEYLHTTAVFQLARHPSSEGALVYNLRQDPTPFLDMTIEELVEAWRFTKDPEILRLPVKTLKYNRVPAIAPLGVIKETATQERLGLTLATINKNLAILKQHKKPFAEKIIKAVNFLDEERSKQQISLVDNQLTVDDRLYDDFFSDHDRQAMRTVHSTPANKIAELSDNFQDERLKNLLPLYKARNYPTELTSEERDIWDNFCRLKLLDSGTESRLAKYFARLAELSQTKLNGQQQYLLEELQLYGETIAPVD